MLPGTAASLASCLTRGDVCHVHVVPRRPAIYRVAWSLFERRERPATSPPPGLGRHARAGLTGVRRTAEPAALSRGQKVLAS